jgi:hypothetical protein
MWIVLVYNPIGLVMVFLPAVLSTIALAFFPRRADIWTFAGFWGVFVFIWDVLYRVFNLEGHWLNLHRGGRFFFVPVLILMLLTLSSGVFASEITLTSAEKVAASNVIALGEIIEIRRGAIRDVKRDQDRRQEVSFKFQIDQVLLGDAPPTIAIQAYSQSYTEDGQIHGATAGFSGHGLHEKEKYLAYLVRRNGVYYLASDSNQFLEHVDEARNRIRANGQTNEYVNLRKKLNQVSKLAKKRKATPKEYDVARDHVLDRGGHSGEPIPK